MKQHSMHTLPMWAKVGFAVTVLLLISAGVWLFRVQQAQHKRHVEDQLASIARLKAKEIADWRAERLADAAVLGTRQDLIQDVGRFFGAPSDGLAQEIKRHLQPLKERFHFSDILLVDPEQRVRLSLNRHAESTHRGYTSTLEAALAGRIAAWTPMHGEAEYPFPHLSVVVPLFGEAEDDRPIGFVVLISDATQFLYPLIQSWPIPSKTAETLLVRRDGDDVLFLNELRHQKDTAMKLRLPMSRPDLPAAMAVAGRTGIVQGKDYRDVDVIAAILPIPDSPWFMVAKVDEDEAYSRWRYSSLLLSGLILGLLGLLVAVGLVVRQRNLKAYYRALYQSEADRRTTLERYRITLDAIGDGVITTDATGRVEFTNPVAEGLTGWTQEQARGRDLKDVFHIINEETREAVEDPVARVLREGTVVGLANHTVLIARDGKEIPIADSGAPIRNEEGEIIGVVLVFRDQSEERLARRLMEARLSLIAYAADHTLDEFLTWAIDVAGDFVSSPIGFYHFVAPDQKTLSLQQWSTRTLEDFCRAEGKGMHYDTGQAGVWVDCVRERRPVIQNDYASLPHRKGMPEGHAEVVRELVVPIMREDKIVAILGLGNKPKDYTQKDVEIVSYLADVTWEIARRMRAQESIEEEKARAQNYLDIAGVIFVALNAKGEVTLINRKGKEILGYSGDEIIGRNWFDSFLPENQRDQVRSVFESLIGGDSDGVEFFENAVLTQAGEEKVIAWRNSFLKDSRGRVIGILSSGEDVTERKSAEAALRESEEKFRHVFEHSPIGKTITFPSGEVHANRAFYKMLGYSEVEAPFLTWQEITHPEDMEVTQQAIDSILAGEKDSTQFIKRYLHKNGSVVWGEVSSTVRRDEKGDPRYFITIINDITERKRAEEDREKLHAQLLQAQKMESVGRLAGGVAHDFNNKLTVMMGYAQMALEGLPKTDPIYANLQQVVKAGEQSADIVRQLLAFARKQTIAPKVLDLNETVEGMLRMLRRLMGEDIDLAWEPDNNLFPVKMDPTQIDQILANLCVNARDAVTGVGKVTIETENVVLDEAYCADHAGFVPGEYVMLGVSDNGCGMDKETLTNAFEPFFTTKEVGRGTGLGLSTVYGIVKQNRGLVNIYSEPGKGTAVKIYLPRYRGEAQGKAEAGPTEIPRGHGETILLVEDDAPVLNLTRITLEKLGYNVLISPGPKEAIAMARKHPGDIHLLLTDVILPEMSGRDLAGEIWKIRPAIRTLYMSGYTANMIAHQGVLDEGVHFIGKPFTPDSLGRKVREALGG